MPTLELVKCAFFCAVECVRSRDSHLLESDASEWAIAHRLAVYLEQQLPGWDVDCEFNRQGEGKRLKLRDTGDAVRPDVIVHHRGQLSVASNLLVVEVKKRPDPHDELKLIEYTKPATHGQSRGFQYRFGAALVLTPLSVTWFENGGRLE